MKEYIEKQGFTKTEITEEVIEDYDVESFKLPKKDKTLHINFNVNEENE